MLLGHEIYEAEGKPTASKQPPRSQMPFNPTLFIQRQLQPGCEGFSESGLTN